MTQDPSKRLLTETTGVLPLTAAAAPTAAQVTRGLYARTQPTSPLYGGTSRPLTVDPNSTGSHSTGRIWAVDQVHDHIVYSDDDGATVVDCGVNPAHSTTPARAAQQLLITANYLWLGVSAQSEAPCSGQIYRAPWSGTPGTLTWTLIWDANGQALGTGGAALTAHANASLRNSSFAVSADETRLFVGSYGNGNNAATRTQAVTDARVFAGSRHIYSEMADWCAGDTQGPAFTVAGAGVGGADLTGVTIVKVISAQEAILSAPARSDVSGATCTFPSATWATGMVVDGPQLFRCPNPTNATPTFTVIKTFRNARHVHSVRFINGLFWVGLGDIGHPWTDQEVGSDVGLWHSTDQSGGTFTQANIVNERAGGNSRDPINVQPVTLNGQPLLLCESDGKFGDGPLLFPNQSTAPAMPLMPTCKVSAPYAGTMRQLGIDPVTKNAYWLNTGEVGGVGPLDSVMMAAPPYTVAIPLESFASTLSTFGTVGDPVISNGYFWIGTHRCTIEKIKGQS